MKNTIVHDPLGDMMNRLKLAGRMEEKLVTVPYSKLRFSVVSLLEKKGFIKSAAKKGKKVIRSIEIELAYHTDGRPRIFGVRRLSKLSRRVYMGAGDIRPVRHGYGILVLTTPKGIMTGSDARKEKVGGEALFEVF